MQFGITLIVTGLHKTSNQSSGSIRTLLCKPSTWRWYCKTEICYRIGRNIYIYIIWFGGRCSMVFRGAHCLHLQNQRISQVTNHGLLFTTSDTPALKTEASYSSVMLLNLYQTTLCHVPEEYTVDYILLKQWFVWLHTVIICLIRDIWRRQYCCFYLYGVQSSDADALPEFPVKPV
jgi:hypothetical protein